ncbi:hypothetical protein GCM10010123_38500 [Pilimelia anulata]|uniref:Secreted protein n=1 Tax=Pilimelia anulata TaxID=53371 RepID=A0A8J3BCW8_9ACTN|nr:DUF4360 domain-containing protein [Pilimelia anulata]GGK04812.1 hypothetical protein GCM10010123_38500 [Pilimelia anulata]
MNPWNRRRGAIAVIPAVCALALAVPASAAPRGTPRPGVTIVDVRSGGSGCPENSAEVVYATDRSAFQVGYRRPFTVTSDAVGVPVEASCSLVITIDIPTGWALTGQKLAFYALYTMGTQSWVRGRITASYRDANGVPQTMRVPVEATAPNTGGQLTAFYEMGHRPSICGGRTVMHVEQSLTAMLGRDSDRDQAKTWMVSGSHDTDSQPASLYTSLTEC